MDDYKAIPIAEARAIAGKYDKDQVLIFAWESKTGKTHITTYGSNKAFCKMAAEGGKKVADMLGLEGERNYEG